MVGLVSVSRTDGGRESSRFTSTSVLYPQSPTETCRPPNPDPSCLLPVPRGILKSVLVSFHENHRRQGSYLPTDKLVPWGRVNLLRSDPRPCLVGYPDSVSSPSELRIPYTPLPLVDPSVDMYFSEETLNPPIKFDRSVGIVVDVLTDSGNMGCKVGWTRSVDRDGP